MSDLLKVNVSEHTDKKGNLTYLSWPWAWAEILKLDPTATWEVVEFDNRPVCVMPDSTAMVKVVVTINKHSKSCWLPVMDHRNKAIKNPDAFAINTAHMRCMVKTVALFGLGLYIYAGEDLPEGDDPVIPANVKVSPTEEAFKSLQPEDQLYCRQIAKRVIETMPDTNRVIDMLDNEGMDAEQKIGVWYLLDSATRSAIKRAQDAQKEPA